MAFALSKLPHLLHEMGIVDSLMHTTVQFLLMLSVFRLEELSFQVKVLILMVFFESLLYDH